MIIEFIYIVKWNPKVTLFFYYVLEKKNINKTYLLFFITPDNILNIQLSLRYYFYQFVLLNELSNLTYFFNKKHLKNTYNFEDFLIFLSQNVSNWMINSNSKS